MSPKFECKYCPGEVFYNLKNFKAHIRAMHPQATKEMGI